jgi:hypothetical protein
MLRVTGLDDPDVLTLGEARQLARTLFNRNTSSPPAA